MRKTAIQFRFIIAQVQILGIVWLVKYDNLNLLKNALGKYLLYTENNFNLMHIVMGTTLSIELHVLSVVRYARRIRERSTSRRCSTVAF